MCFKCCGYGHPAKYCQNKECCHKCGEEHLAKDCLENDFSLNCPNCRVMGYSETCHSARDPECPVYKRKIGRTRLNVNYGESFLE